jgi:CRISPR-associated endonuclease Csn1
MNLQIEMEIILKRISDWTKRNDHRHHAMDAITVAFTKRSHVQYLNNLKCKKRQGKQYLRYRTKRTLPR